MRDLLKQDRPLSPATVRTATSLLSVLFGIAALIILVFGVANLFQQSTFIVGVLQICGGLGLLLTLFLIVRLLSDGVMALHRLNDRVILQTEALAERVTGTPAKSAPNRTPARKTASRAKKQTASTASAPETNES